MSMNEQWQAGDLVTASYKTGQYIGEIVEPPGMTKAAVQILAVLKHPTQGDLHHPMDPNVPFFHQRRALAFREIALMPLGTIQPYRGTVPDYTDSLRQALAKDMEALRRTISFANRCLQELEQLKTDYRL